MSVVIETTVGDITVDLYLKERPNASLNFLKLCKIKYYNLCIFHKVERNFIAQTGDPTSTGRGGESVFSHLYGDQAKYFDTEMKPRLKHEKLGTLSMVNNGNNMNGSQFFLTLGENLTYLDEVHTIFGEVTEGFDTLMKINEAICDPNNNRPYQDIRITHTVVLHDPFDDSEGLEIPDASPEPTREQLESNYIGADEEIDDTKGKNVEEIEEKIKDSEAKARATILEMVGDIPDAEVKPPENVLFVCKLNPVTTSEDLEIIFSRFGTIVSCEVIKDKQSGESLQYAFIEFEKEEDCENAYFKMDNVLIDDRRIHVDFSQSVSKMNWDWKNRPLKNNATRGQNFVIKERSKKTDGYDMIFDMGDDSTGTKSQYVSRSPDTRRKKHDPRSSEVPYRTIYKRLRSPDSKNRRNLKSSDKRSHIGLEFPEVSHKRSSRRSGSPDISHSSNGKKSKSSESNHYHKEKYYDNNEYHSSKKSTYETETGSRSNPMKNFQGISRSISPAASKNKSSNKKSKHHGESSEISSSRISEETRIRKQHRDSTSSNNSSSPMLLQMSKQKRPSNTKDIHNEKRKYRSNERSSSPEFLNMAMKTSKQTSHQSRSEESSNHKKSAAKRQQSEMKNLSYARYRSSSPEPSKIIRKTSDRTSRQSDESYNCKKYSSSRASANYSASSSPESFHLSYKALKSDKDNRFVNHQSEYTKHKKHSERTGKSFKDSDSSASGNTHHKYSEAPSLKLGHASKSKKHSHKEQKRRKRSHS